MKAVFLWLDQLSWHGFLLLCQLGATFHCALHFIYTLSEARSPCRLLNHLGVALVQILAGSWLLCGFLNSLGMNIVQTPTESSVPEACCFHLLILSGNTKRRAILQTTSDFFYLSLEVSERKNPKHSQIKKHYVKHSVKPPFQNKLEVQPLCFWVSSMWVVKLQLTVINLQRNEGLACGML